MNRTARYLLGAAVLIAVGVLLLLQNLGVITGAENIFWTLGFFAGGAVFLTIFGLMPHSQWWAAIPGMVLVGLGVVVGFGEQIGEFAGSMFLIALALSFWLIFATNRSFWWAIIPAGVLTSVTVVSFLPERIGDFETGGILFLGLALTFALVYLLSGKQRARWALWPAAILLVVGVISYLSSTETLNWVWAVALILVGLYLVVRALTITLRRPKPAAPVAPAEPAVPASPPQGGPPSPPIEPPGGVS